MPPRARNFTAFISNSSNELLTYVRTKAADRIPRKLNNIYSKIRKVDFRGSEYFLRSARHHIGTNELEKGTRALEIGLKKYPSAEALLELYLHICCERGQFLRILDFIGGPSKKVYKHKKIYKTLSGLRVSDQNASLPATGEEKKHALVWLAEKFISKNFDDPTAFWRLADLLEYQKEGSTAKKLYLRLSERPVITYIDYYYAGMSEMRLHNTDRGFEKLEIGLAAYPDAECISSVLEYYCYVHFDLTHYLKLRGDASNEQSSKNALELSFYRNAFRQTSPDTFILKFHHLESNCHSEAFHVLKEEFLANLRDTEVNFEKAKLLVFLCRYLDIDDDFSQKLFDILYSLDWNKNKNSVSSKHLLMVLRKLTLPIAVRHTHELEEAARKFVTDAQTLAEKSIRLDEPISDMGNYWYTWQSLFCLVQPRVYRHAMAAFERLALGLWPRLDYTAPHIHHPPSLRRSTRKIRVGFTVLDAMPMMSGFMELMDRDIFETVYLRPGGAGESRTASDWVARSGTTVEYSDTDVYSAINTIASQELDILISGPSAPQVFFPVMARLAHLQMVLLEPNWPDGTKNSDYYISWQMAEPGNYKDFYKTSVSLMQHPPYWIEASSLGKGSAVSDDTGDTIRQRLLGLRPDDRFYICANTAPKIHLEMDEILYKLLETDANSYLVLLRAEHAMSFPLKARLQERLGRYYKRVIFLNTLKRDDAHSLLLSADCCIDSYPIGGMSSSFDGLMLGVPIVTLPADIPFGRWTAAIYEYIGVSDLTARDIDDYIRIAMRLAIDKDWRLQKSAEIREKSSRYIESKVSFDEFQHFIVEAWRRKQAGLPPENWVAGKWQ